MENVEKDINTLIQFVFDQGFDEPDLVEAATRLEDFLDSEEFRKLVD